MKVFYKALASIGMIALSTAAAIGIRHLARAVKKNAQQPDDSKAQDAAQPNANADAAEDAPEQADADEAVDADVSDADDADEESHEA